MKYEIPVQRNVYELTSRLQEAGFQAYIVGGAIRDHLLGRTPKDYDVSTSATPEEVREVFGRRNARIIGKRFRLVHVFVGKERFEVSTFRKAPQQHAGDRANKQDLPENMILSDNDFGTAEEDAWRRDFTVNALFYDPVKQELLDYTGQGLKDIQSHVVRAIGEPKLRFEEDPVRMLRALKLVGQYDFSLDAATENALFGCLPLICHAAPSRLSLELEKIFESCFGDRHLQTFHDFGLLSYFLPEIEKAWDTPVCEYMLDLLNERNCRVAEGRYRNSVSLAMAAAALPFVEKELGNEPGQLWELSPAASPVIEEVLNHLFRPQTMMIRMTLSAQRVLQLQPRVADPEYDVDSINATHSYPHARELHLICTAVQGGDLRAEEERLTVVPETRSRRRPEKKRGFRSGKRGQRPRRAEMLADAMAEEEE